MANLPDIRIIGLTGSIGMGKSTTARMFRDSGVAVYDADAAVHALYRRGGAGVAPVEAAFPQAVVDGVVDRAKLSALVLPDPAALARLEGIVHPLLRAERAAFVHAERARRAGLCVLDIPLLFETGGENDVDAIVVVSADPATQRRRVLDRGTMSEAQFEAIVAKQTPDAEKRRRAHWLIDTGRGFAYARRQTHAFLKAMGL